MGVEPSLQADEARRILGVAPGLSGAPLRRAYLAAVKTSHPDRPGGDAARLRAVIAAYALLKASPAPPSGGRGAPPPAAERLVITPAVAVAGGSTSVRLNDGQPVNVTLPAGLRHGDRVRVDGRVLTVLVRTEAGASVLGDHLCLTLEVDPRILGHGGRISVATPAGEQTVWVSRAAAARGLVRVPGQGLPGRGVHPTGHLFIRLRPSAERPAEPASRDLLRRFAATWAA